MRDILAPTGSTTRANSQSTARGAVPRRRWGIALLLGFGVLVNYFDRVNLSISRDALHEAFGISAVMFGYLSSAYNWTYAALQLPSGLLLDRFGVRRVGIFSTVIWSVASFAAALATGLSGLFGYLFSAYNWTYAALQLPSGLLLDRFGVRRVGIFSTVIWSVASFAAALATGLGGLFGARFLLGIGEAPTFPAYAKATGYWFPKSERSLATATFDSMAKFSSAIGVPILGLLLLHFGWRWNFAATGIVSLVYFADENLAIES